MSEQRIEPWMQTLSGVPFDLLAPRAEDVLPDEIAVSLSRIARYLGHTRVSDSCGYSVAQHSVLCADLIRTWGGDAALEREALLHDAAEAYYGDVTSPVQRALRDIYRETVAVCLDHCMRRWEGTPEGVTAHLALQGFADMLAPLDPFRELKARIDPVVRQALGLPAQEHPLVKRADLVALAIERKLLMAPCARDWKLPELADIRWEIINVQHPERAASVFLDRLSELDDRVGYRLAEPEGVPRG